MVSHILAQGGQNGFQTPLYRLYYCIWYCIGFCYNHNYNIRNSTAVHFYCLCFECEYGMFIYHNMHSIHRGSLRLIMKTTGIVHMLSYHEHYTAVPRLMHPAVGFLNHMCVSSRVLEYMCAFVWNGFLFPCPRPVLRPWRGYTVKHNRWSFHGHTFSVAV